MELYSKEELLKELKKEYSCGGECEHCSEVLDAGSCSVLRCIRRIIDKAQPVKFSLMPADESKDEAYLRGYEKGKVDGFLKARPQEWIPISERLPKYNKTVLISVKQIGKEAQVFTAQRRRRIKTPDIFKCCTDNDGWWDFEISAWDNHEVLAWMPLPEPYKKGGAV